MKKFLLALALVGFMGGIGEAQTSISVDINKAKLQWSWSQGTGSPADEFRVKCGPSSGNYTKTTVVPSPTTEVAVSSAIGGLGAWFCVVTAANQFGESAPTNEISFVAGTIPGAPSGLQVVAQ